MIVEWGDLALYGTFGSAIYCSFLENTGPRGPFYDGHLWLSENNENKASVKAYAVGISLCWGQPKGPRHHYFLNSVAGTTSAVAAAADGATDVDADSDSDAAAVECGWC